MLVQKVFKQRASQTKHIYRPTFFSALTLSNTYHPLSTFPYTKRTHTEYLLVCQAVSWALGMQNTCPQGGRPRGPPTSRQLSAIQPIKFSARGRSWVWWPQDLGWVRNRWYICEILGLKGGRTRSIPNNQHKLGLQCWGLGMAIPGTAPWEMGQQGKQEQRSWQDVQKQSAPTGRRKPAPLLIFSSCVKK